jgi:L-serine dehydratase
MRYDSIFDVAGHIMVGPSSSHTAGACRIGYIAQLLLGTPPKEVKIFLHGSFADTYRGHKTDVAIIGGLLGFPPYDERLPHSFQLAEKMGLQFTFTFRDLGLDYHPNTVLIEMQTDQETLSIIGSSIGGGNIVIEEINGLEAGFDGNSPTIIEVHKDIRGMLANISSVISMMGLQIKEMHLSRNIRKGIAMSWIECSQSISKEIQEALENIPDMISVRCLNV